MKKWFQFVLILLSVEGYSQFSVDFQSTLVNLIPLKLSNTETKYLDQHINWDTQNQFSLLNLDGSLYKIIQMPPKPDSTSVIEVVNFVSNSLFDNDPSTIEYLVHNDPCDSTLSGLLLLNKENCHLSSNQMNQIDLRPEHRTILAELASLKDLYLTHVLKLQELTGTVKPNLEAMYAVKIGQLFLMTHEPENEFDGWAITIWQRTGRWRRS
jgi:hypothetical protein